MPRKNLVSRKAKYKVSLDHFVIAVSWYMYMYKVDEKAKDSIKLLTLFG